MHFRGVRQSFEIPGEDGGRYRISGIPQRENVDAGRVDVGQDGRGRVVGRRLAADEVLHRVLGVQRLGQLSRERDRRGRHSAGRGIARVVADDGDVVGHRGQRRRLALPDVDGDGGESQSGHGLLLLDGEALGQPLVDALRMFGVPLLPGGDDGRARAGVDVGAVRAVVVDEREARWGRSLIQDIIRPRLAACTGR